MSETPKTQPQGESGTQASNTQENSWVNEHEEFMNRMRASGLTVTSDEEESDGTEYQVTFPQRLVSAAPPSSSTKSTPRRRRVTVTVFWGNDDVEVSVKIPRKTWQQIKDGMPWSAASRYYYEGKRYTASWSFNGSKKGSLHVSYGDDGADGYIGSIAGAYVDES